MMMLTNVQTTSVAAYFECETDWSLDGLLRSHKILLGDGSSMGFVNGVITKPEAILLAKKLFADRNEEVSELFISSDAVRVRNVKDYFGKSVFTELDEQICGWCVFFNPMVYANWGHECTYCFIVDENNVFEKSYHRAVDESVTMDKI